MSARFVDSICTTCAASLKNVAPPSSTCARPAWTCRRPRRRRRQQRQRLPAVEPEPVATQTSGIVAARRQRRRRRQLRHHHCRRSRPPRSSRPARPWQWQPQHRWAVPQPAGVLNRLLDGTAAVAASAPAPMAVVTGAAAVARRVPAMPAAGLPATSRRRSRRRRPALAARSQPSKRQHGRSLLMVEMLRRRPQCQRLQQQQQVRGPQRASACGARPRTPRSWYPSRKASRIGLRLADDGSNTVVLTMRVQASPPVL